MLYHRLINREVVSTALHFSSQSINFNQCLNNSNRRRFSFVSSNLNTQNNSKIQTMSIHESFLTFDNMNPNVKLMEYFLSGSLVARAAEIERELNQGVKKPFNEVIRANIGDCQAMGQPPITFVRQVISLVLYNQLFNDAKIPWDVQQRAQTLLDDCEGKSIGFYSDPSGMYVVRKHIAEYIQRRDGGIAADWQSVIVSYGASGAIRSVLSLLCCTINNKPSGVLVPIPLNPLYLTTLTELGMEQVNYYLNESKNWSVDVPELQRAIDNAKKFCTPRVLVVINPGNPTGQVMTKETIQSIIEFAYKEELLILADEVHQDNIYTPDRKFHSFKKVMVEMGAPYSEMELASVMSSSNSFAGECGIRGGYVELYNICPEIRAMLRKCQSAQACPTTVGQVCMDAVVNPPMPDEPSYELWLREKTASLNELKLRAELVVKTLNSIDGFTCSPVQGAVYAFPRVKLPPKAIEAAKSVGQKPDEFYVWQLLEKCGVLVVPGSNFGLIDGTYHFRMTILPPMNKLKKMLETINSFHVEFLKEYE